MSGEDTIENAIEMANVGDPMAGTRLLWPLIPESEHRDEALFALAFCFEKANNFATAHYLYVRILELYPDFESARNRVEKCREIVTEKGLIEDFEDIGHRECLACNLRYRAEYILCPYCGTPKDQAKSQASTDEFFENHQKKEWKDPSIVDSLGEMGRGAADKVQEFVESDKVKEFSGKVQSSTRSALGKAKEFTSQKKVKEVTDRGSEVGREVAGKAEDLTKNKGLRDVAKKIEDISWQASDAMKGLIKGDKSSDSGESEPRGEEFVDRAKSFGKNVLRNIRDAIDPDKNEKKRDE